MPRMLERFGLIGYTVPPNGLRSRFHRIVRPTAPAFSVAPITATAFGLMKASSCRADVSLRTMFGVSVSVMSLYLEIIGCGLHADDRTRRLPYDRIRVCP